MGSDLVSCRLSSFDGTEHPCKRRVTRLESRDDLRARTARTGRQSWDEHYTDERDAAYSVPGACRRSSVTPSAASSSSSSRWSRTGTRSDGRSCFARAGVRCQPTRPPRGRALLAWVAKPVRHLVGAAADPRGRGARGAGLPRPRAPIDATGRLTGPRSTSPRTPRFTRASCRRSWGAKASPGTSAAAGGYLRSIVYGFNDGLTANFGLVAGVDRRRRGAAHRASSAAWPGAIADALSMGSSGYLAAKSEAEVQAHQIEMERHEMRADAGSRGGGARGHLRGEGAAAGARARDRRER